MLITVITAFSLGIIVIPLKSKIQELVDRIFFQGSQTEIFQQNELFRKEAAQTDKLKAIATLASGIAHEIRNPITAIKTFSEYLPQRASDQEFLKNYTETVRKEIDRIDSLIKNLLNFAKPSPPDLKRTEIHGLIEETLNLTFGKLEKSNIQLIKDFTNNDLHIQLDANQIKQALLNILLNAIDSMPRGGELTIKTGQPSHNVVEIRIQDTGCGIPKEDLPHIFDPFFSKRTAGPG